LIFNTSPVRMLSPNTETNLRGLADFCGAVPRVPLTPTVEYGVVAWPEKFWAWIACDRVSNVVSTIE
jgi:hypothetical protein